MGPLHICPHGPDVPRPSLRSVDSNMLQVSLSFCSLEVPRGRKGTGADNYICPLPLGWLLLGQYRAYIINLHNAYSLHHKKINNLVFSNKSASFPGMTV